MLDEAAFLISTALQSAVDGSAFALHSGVSTATCGWMLVFDWNDWRMLVGSVVAVPLSTVNNV